MRTMRDPLALAMTVAGWAVGLATTAVIVGTPFLLFAYHGPEVHLVLDSLDSGVALLAAYLLYGRFTRTRQLQDLLSGAGTDPARARRCRDDLGPSTADGRAGGQPSPSGFRSRCA